MRMNRLFFALSFLLIAGFSFGQETSDIKQWKQIQSVDGITIFSRKGDCNQPKVASYTEEVYLKFTNTTDQVVYVEWSYDVTYGDKCYNCDGENQEMTQTIKLQPNSSIEGVCGDKNDLRLRIFSKFTNMDNPEPMTDYNVKNVVVRSEN